MIRLILVWLSAHGRRYAFSRCDSFVIRFKSQSPDTVNVHVWLKDDDITGLETIFRDIILSGAKKTIVNGRVRKIIGALLITPPFADEDGNIVIIPIPVNPLSTITPTPTRTMSSMSTDMLTTTIGPGTVFISFFKMNRGTAFPTRLHVRRARTQISLHILLGWWASSQSTWRRFKSLTTYIVLCEDSDQTAPMRRLIWFLFSLRAHVMWQETLCSNNPVPVVFAWRKCYMVENPVYRFK